LLREYVARSSCAVDVGTGGGEVYSVAARVGDVALEFDPDRIDIARTRLPCPLVRGDQARLPFADHSFDLLADRHVGVDTSEVLRVLRPDGIYLTQRPGGRICQNIFEATGWGSNDQFWRRVDGTTYRDFDSTVAWYQLAGCEIVRREDANVDYEFLDEEALAFWLANAPLPAIDIDRDAEKLDRLPLRTNWHSNLLIVKTPSSEARR
jgi:SAM-dependent methyltransferase